MEKIYKAIPADKRQTISFGLPPEIKFSTASLVATMNYALQALRSQSNLVTVGWLVHTMEQAKLNKCLCFKSVGILINQGFIDINGSIHSFPEGRQIIRYHAKAHFQVGPDDEILELVKYWRVVPSN